MDFRFRGATFVVIFCFTVCIYAQNSYIALFPKNIRPNLDTEVYLHILKPDPNVSVKVSLVDSKGETINSAFVDMVGEFNRQRILLKIPSDLTIGDYNITIEGTGTPRINNSSKVTYKTKSSSVMIQTDKAIYKPGQTVNFRMFGIFPDLTIVHSPFDIDIYDPNGNKIAQWRNATPHNGVYTGLMEMSDKPVLGDWRIEAVQERERTEKTFTVDKYVLPKFEVNFVLPPFGLAGETFLSFKIVAKYTYGKPVKGTGMLRIRPPYVESWRKGQEGYAEELVQRFTINGEESFEIPIANLTTMRKNLGYGEMIFEANVTDDASGRRMNASDTLTFYDYENKVTFLKSLPKNFKPGLKYTVLMKVTRQDDSPVVNPMSRVNATVRYTYQVKKNETTTTTTPVPPPVEGAPLEPMPIPRLDVIRGPWMPGPFIPTEEKTLEPKVFEVPPNGIIAFDLDVPADVTRVSINANYENSSAYLSLDPSRSPSDNFIQITLQDKKPMAGNTSLFEIKVTEPVDTVYFQIFSKGRLVDAGDIYVAGRQITAYLGMTNEMVPKARVIVYYIRPTGEVVTDGITINVDGTFRNKVSLSFDVPQVKPGEEVIVEVKADPYSSVHLLAVDKSVLLMKSGNDVTEGDVLSELESYDAMGGGGGIFPIFWDWRWPIPSGGLDAHDVFDKNGVIVLTDALVYNYEEPQTRMRFFAMPMMAMAESAVMDSPMGGAGPNNNAPAGRTRKFFPETWLWSNETLGQDGTMRMSVVAPDTITSWVATAFAVNNVTGLGLTPSPSTIEVFKPFFVSINLPYSVIRGEMVLLSVNIFNYLRFPVKAIAVIFRNDGWENIVTYKNDTGYYRNRSSETLGRILTIQPGEVASLYFPIVPKTLGDLTLTLGAYSKQATDLVTRTLKVKPEGTEKEFNTPVLVTPDGNGQFYRDVNITFPPNTVVGSKKVRINVLGDIMGPSVNGIEKLLKMPYGCGEQNMLNFAPNIFIQKYLVATNNLSPDTEAKSKRYMLKGYQRELTYTHDDGSFSAFGKRDKSGSTWLTAFVVKSFAQASNYIDIDGNVIRKAINFLISQQNPDGSSNEPGKVLHSEMQGGSAGGNVSLTAFVLIALVEADSYLTPEHRYNITKTVTYLENAIASINNPYELALVAYALNLAGSTVADAMMKLSSIAIRKDGMIYWENPEEETKSWKSWRPVIEQARGIDIETTAYALLTYARDNDVVGGVPLLKWITSKRNPDGGFSSTQDTVVALQALSEFAKLIFSPNFNMDIVVSGYSSSGLINKNFKIDQRNALVLQTETLPDDIGTVTVSGMGSGIALVELATFFNVMEDLQNAAFDANVTLSNESKKGFTIKVCGRWLRAKTSDMAMMDIGIPTGMSADMESFDTSEAPMYKDSEFGDRKLSIYFDEFDSRPQCVSVYMEADTKVGEMQPAVVKLYDYYDPKKQVTKFYEVGSLKKADLCDLCGEECFCPKLLDPR